jgi:hypothetical protein
MRDYKKEYANYHSKPEQKKDRAGRNHQLLKQEQRSSKTGKKANA